MKVQLIGSISLNFDKIIELDENTKIQDIFKMDNLDLFDKFIDIENDCEEDVDSIEIDVNGPLK